MKHSTFTKQLSVIGKLRIANGKIIVTMNYSTTTKTGTHAVTHDDYSNTMPTHLVQAYIGDTEIRHVNGLTSEQLVLSAVAGIEKELLERMQNLADNPEEKSFVDKMADLGFESY